MEHDSATRDFWIFSNFPSFVFWLPYPEFHGDDFSWCHTLPTYGFYFRHFFARHQQGLLRCPVWAVFFARCNEKQRQQVRTEKEF